MNAEQILMLLSGVAWSIVYVDAIRIGIKDKSYAMPFWALAFNLAWEFLHAVLGYREIGLSLQIVINAVWFLLDLGLLYTFLKYGRKYFAVGLKSIWFHGCSIVGLATAFIVELAFILEFGLLMGAVYSAFLQNLLMSLLFIFMLIKRRSGEGQTLLIGVSKWVGTVAPTMLMGILGIKDVLAPNLLVLITGSLICIFDLIYIILLILVKRNSRPSLSS